MGATHRHSDGDILTQRDDGEKLRNDGRGSSGRARRRRGGAFPRRARALPAFLVFFLLFPFPFFDTLLAGAAGAGQKTTEKPSLRAGRLPKDLRIDGLLDEAAWKDAEAIENLTMVEPDEGAKPTGRTIVKVLADKKNIVIGFRCLDPDPKGIVSYSVARDSSLHHEDHVKIVLDTFGDGRTGYVFAVNPSGARYDALVTDRGEDENRDWDGIWEARTVRSSEGWAAEIRIPVMTLAFKKGLHTWFFNVQRRIQRLMETSRWAGAHRDYEITQTRHAGLLTGLPDFDLGIGLSVTPSLVGGYGSEAPREPSEFDEDFSLDVTQKLGPNLLASLTYNTDFAETDVDVWRSNLTRFPLFYPEKRAFFLEGSEVFDFGLGLGRDVVPFHSRRIGLVEGEEVPLRAGAKLNGKVGGTSLGALFVNMREDPGMAPETNMGVIRLRQDIFEESSAGFITTFGDPLGRRGSWMAGGDFTYQISDFLGDKNFLVGVWGLTMDRDDIEGSSRSAVGGKIDYPNDLWDVSLSWKRIGEDFDPSLGFVPRPGINKYSFGADYMPRPEWDLVRQMYYEFSSSFTTDLDGSWESYSVFTAPFNWLFESGDTLEFNVLFQGEKLDDDFEISDGVVIPAGAYDWKRFRIQAGSASKRPLYGEVAYWFGPFYDGTLNTVELDGIWNPHPLLTFQVSGERNMANLDEGNFTEDVYGGKIRVNFSSDLALSSFTQYETSDHAVGTNLRLHWTVTPSSTLYFVYNQNWTRTDGRWRRESYDARVKIEYTFRF